MTRLTGLASTALLVALSGALAGCGSDDGDNEDGDAGVSPSSTTSSSDDASSVPASPSASPSAAAVDYCANVDVLSTLDGSIESDEELAEARAAVQALVRTAPPEVAADWKVAGRAFQKYFAILEKDYLDTTDLPPGVTQDEADERNTETVRRAVDEIRPAQAELIRIGEHGTTECGLE